MFKAAITNIANICNYINDFALIIDYADKIIKIVDANEYENDIISIHFVDDEIDCYNEKYVEYPFIVDTIEELNTFICRNILTLEFEMLLDEIDLNTSNFKELLECLGKMNAMYILN